MGTGAKQTPHGQTLVEKVLSRVSEDSSSVFAGDYIWAVPDLVIAHDLNYPRYRQMMVDAGIPNVAHPEKVFITIDHRTFIGDAKSLADHQFMREDARIQKIKTFLDIGRQGISHNAPLDLDLVHPGMLVLASDTRAPALGCKGAVSIAIGISLVTVLSIGKAWLRVPETIRLSLSGSPRPGVMSRDIAQWLANQIGREKGDYRSIEFDGPYVDSLDADGRSTLCNAMVDIGVKAAVCSHKTMAEEPFGFGAVESDRDASFAESLCVNVSKLEPQISLPPDPENVTTLSSLKGKKVNNAFVGSCIGGKLEDISAAAEVLRGHKVNSGVRLTVIPSTQDIYKEALKRGYIEVFAEAGATVVVGICGPCYGTFAPLVDDDVMICTATRNEPGRMGSSKATIYIANAAVVAASAVVGYVIEPCELPQKEEVV